VQPGVVRHEFDCVGGEIFEPKWHPDEVRPLEQFPHAVDHLARPAIVPDDVVDTRSQLLEIRLRARQEPVRRLRVGENRRQRLAQLVRERRGQLTHAGDPVEMGELSQQALRGRLGLLAATTLKEQRNDQCRLHADEPGRPRRATGTSARG
jgi:hypothetical protein